MHSYGYNSRVALFPIFNHNLTNLNLHLTQFFKSYSSNHIFDLGCQPLDIAWPVGVVVVERADVAELLNARHVLQQQVNHVKAQLSSLGQDESVDSGEALGVDPLFHAEWAQALDAHHLHTLEVGPTNVKKNKTIIGQTSSFSLLQ